MSEKDALVAAILAAPHNDSARLDFANWLEDHADPRAGCLRLAAQLRKSYGPCHPHHSRSFWQTLTGGIKPAWVAEEVRRLADEVDAKVGDGSKTAVLVALALVEASLLFPNGWGGSDALRRAGLQVAQTLEELTVRPRSPEELRRCLRSAALGDDGVAAALLSAFSKAGPDGLLNVRGISPGLSRQRVRVLVQEGLIFPLSGLENLEGRELQSVAVLVSLRPLQGTEVRQTLASYPRVAAALLCLCPGCDAEGAELFWNARYDNDHILICTSLLGRWRDSFEDAAVATGAKLINADEAGPATIAPVRFGRADSVRIDAGQLVIKGPGGPPGAVRSWINHLHQLIEETSEQEQEWHCHRAAQLTGGAVTIEVCGQSLPETEQLDELTCGALHAGRASIAEGYLPGAGVAYLRGASANLESPASEALRWALEEPTRVLLAGSRLDVRETLISLRADEGLGLDVVGNKLPRWRADGPIDPTRVVRAVIESAIESAIRTTASGSSRGSG